MVGVVNVAVLGRTSEWASTRWNLPPLGFKHLELIGVVYLVLLLPVPILGSQFRRASMERGVEPIRLNDCEHWLGRVYVTGLLDRAERAVLLVPQRASLGILERTSRLLAAPRTRAGPLSPRSSVLKAAVLPSLAIVADFAFWIPPPGLLDVLGTLSLCLLAASVRLRFRILFGTYTLFAAFAAASQVVVIVVVVVVVVVVAVSAGSNCDIVARVYLTTTAATTRR